MTPRERQAGYNRRYRERHGEERREERRKPGKEKVRAICPGCGKTHKYRFDYGWTGRGVPRMQCPRCVITYELYQGLSEVEVVM